MPRFSIILPVFVGNEYRQNSLKRAIESVEKQTFKDFELIVVNDGSTTEFTVPKWVKLINKEHEERIVAYGTGFKKAKGKIFCTLDSDDEYETTYLETVDRYFTKYPKSKLFNFGAKYIHTDGTTSTREAFKPKKKKKGHEVFGGGNIVSGTFVWAKEVYDDLGAFPPTHNIDIDTTDINYPPFRGAEKPYLRELHMTTPYDFSAYAQVEFPELRQYFMVDHEAEPDKIIKELGNPWGNDHYLFYKYTRKYHSKPMKDKLYIVHTRDGIM